MMRQSMFERDLLYPTEKQFEPGSVHITVFQPEESGGIPILIEAKTFHNPLDYISDIIGLLQADVFDRIRIDIRKSGILFFKSDENRYFKVKYLDKGVFQTEPIESF